MITFYDTQEEARTEAAAHGLREKVLCFVVQGSLAQGERLLVFDHVPDGDSGVQVVAGGLEAGESPEAAAGRELWEESGLTLRDPQFLVSYLWEAPLPDRFTRQVCHAYAFAAPDGLPDTWDHTADGHLFRFRWEPLAVPDLDGKILARKILDWEMDAALPHLHNLLAQNCWAQNR